jgi:hypothetical protein
MVWQSGVRCGLAQAILGLAGSAKRGTVGRGIAMFGKAICGCVAVSGWVKYCDVRSGGVR